MSKRTEQVSQLIQNQLGEIISREIELPEGSFITITRVEISPDLKNANVWISILPTGMRGTVLEVLRKNMGGLRKALGQRLTMRSTPKIFFRVDVTEEEAGEIEKILDEIKANQK